MDYKILDGADKMKLDDIVALLHTTYWASARTPEQIETSVQNSDCYGVYLENEGKLVGFARVITDCATTYYLCDVVIDEAYRNQGLGTALIAYVESRPAYAGLRGVLITRDAQSFYKKFGYDVLDGRAMVKGLNC